MNRKKEKIMVLLLVLSIILVTTGTTLAFFTYKATGETVSTITTGGITFHYKEMQGKGHGISISDALPVASNDNAKRSNDYFDFKITSTVTDGVQIPYTVTARMSDDSDSIMGNIINIYLTEVDGNSETATALFSGDLVKYNNLEDYENRGSYTEKVIYRDTVSSASYEKNFRLRMWIDQNTNLNTGNGTSNYNNKTFSITVNVNATGQQSSNGNNGGSTPSLIPVITDNDEDGNLSRGDLVCYSTECFYVFDTDPTGNTRMLSQYNLKVGRNYEFNGEQWEYTIYPIDPSEEGYGLQDATMNGGMPEQDSNHEYHGFENGAVAFSSKMYMLDDQGNLLDVYKRTGYGETFPACNMNDIYNSNYSTVAPNYDGLDTFSSDYSIAYYVEPYGEVLEEMGVPFSDIRLLTFKDVDDSGCYIQNNRISNDCKFVYSTTYWLASIVSINNGMCVIEKDDYYPLCGDIYASQANEGGVRPIITVPTNTLSLD